jgi:hypothetical protein
MSELLYSSLAHLQLLATAAGASFCYTGQGLIAIGPRSLSRITAAHVEKTGVEKIMRQSAEPEAKETGK